MSDADRTEVIRLRKLTDELRQHNAAAYEQIAAITYKYGVVAAILGLDADKPLKEVQDQARRLKMRYERALQLSQDERGYTREELIKWLDDPLWK